MTKAISVFFAALPARRARVTFRRRRGAEAIVRCCRSPPREKVVRSSGRVALVRSFEHDTHLSARYTMELKNTALNVARRQHPCAVALSRQAHQVPEGTERIRHDGRTKMKNLKPVLR